MDKERVWILIGLKLSGEASSAELAELESLLEAPENSGFKLMLLQQLWEAEPAANENTDVLFSRHMQRLSNHLGKPVLQYDDAPEEGPSGLLRSSKPFYLRYGMALAAGVLVVVLFVYLLPGKSSKKQLATNAVSTRPGSKSKISLPDGTQVWLNSDSKITYDESFSGSSREVELTGEAYFDVVKNKDRPFIIHTSAMDVRVLGTAFNVRAYPDEETAETSLIRGLVEVTLKNNSGKKIILQPNEKLVVQEALPDTLINKKTYASVAPILTISTLHYLKGDSTAMETSWLKNKLAFDREKLENVAKKIERWYGVTITITDDKLRSVEYTGDFQDESLREVLNALQLTGGFRFNIQQRNVTITP